MYSYPLNRFGFDFHSIFALREAWNASIEQPRISSTNFWAQKLSVWLHWRVFLLSSCLEVSEKFSTAYELHDEVDRHRVLKTAKHTNYEGMMESSKDILLSSQMLNLQWKTSLSMESQLNLSALFVGYQKGCAAKSPPSSFIITGLEHALGL